MFFTRLAREHGDVALVGMGPEKIVLVSHPDLVREVLVAQSRRFMKGRALQEAKRILGEGLLTSEGELHLRQRRLVQPLFHAERLGGYGDVMVDLAGRTAERWRPGEAVDVAAEMQRLTLAVVGRTLFDADVEGAARDVGEALTTSLEMMDLFMLPFAGLRERLPLPSTRRFRAARERLDTIIYGMIEERRGRAGGEDLLSLLLEARDEEGAPMSERQVRDESMTLFLAGHETTAQALAWTWYLLSENPEAERRLHAELDEVLGGRPPTAADVPALELTRRVLAESMRLYPPAWVVGRRALEDVELGGYRVPAGTLTVVSQWVTHRDPRWWPDPLRFEPDRFTPEGEAARPRHAYFPFGAGTRMCIGERFAWMEGILVLAAIAQRRRLRLVSGHPVATLPLVTLRPRHGMRMTVEHRG